ncbi:MAG: potassium channel family protein [Deltaproteobacteria bacterium]|nr:potassium channel family protein [Deltaproteobacteria bacterium]
MSDSRSPSTPRLLDRARDSIRGVWVVVVMVGPFAYGISGGVRAASAIALAVLLHVFIAFRLDRQQGPIVAAGAAVLMGLLVSLTTSLQASVVHVAVPLYFCVGFLDGFRVSAMDTIRHAAMVTAGTMAVICIALIPEHAAGGVLGSSLVFAPLVVALASTGGATPDEHERSAASRWLGRVGRLALALATPAMLFIAMRHELADPPSQLLAAVAVALSASLVFLASRKFARWLDPRLKFLVVLGRYLRAMAVPLGGFTLGYFAIVIVFAGLFASLARLYPGSFVGLPAGSDFAEWFYLSLATATTLGYGDLAPVTLAAKVLVGLEAILATGWLVAVFAAVTAYLQPRLSQLSEPTDTTA